MTNQVIDRAALERKARYGHKKIIYWYGEDGSLKFGSFNRETIKRAILEVRFKRAFYWFDSAGCSHIAKSWRMKTHLFKCCSA